MISSGTVYIFVDKETTAIKNIYSMRSIQVRTISNFTFLWLDSNIDENNLVCQYSFTQLRRIANYPSGSILVNVLLIMMLNRALRIQDVEIILKMGFFLRDIHWKLEGLHSQIDHQNRVTVYQGKSMSNFDSQEIKIRKMDYWFSILFYSPV